MRLVKTTALATTLALAACSNAPSEADITKVQKDMAACATDVLKTEAPALLKVKGELGLGFLSAKTPSANADFTVSASIPEYEQKMEFKGKERNARIEDLLTFKSVAGKHSVSLSSLVNATADGGPNLYLAAEPLNAAEPYKDINVKVILDKLQTECANKGYAALQPK